ncbi:hypothetical protein Pst134EA_031929 [Puccinia striiformis f. sp. tritici]|uniref:uncharacterized protein n=1 Tax=Puccinia striiformis f. sp. tritici TaxID=168172 RepID=UPI002007AB42|nr:uncharacterized protein Pst134EA_031929 [Puccinia striiformis f. sp. tritici]KAH9442568.1 hypothetical protein Pst134EA_031929 [Puccinia striiformis f. sp. tritici]
MLGLKARMLIIDNSGGLIAECINVLKFKGRQGHARGGDEIVCVIKRARPIPQNSSGPSSSSSNLLASNKKGGDRADKKETNRADGRSIRFDDNAAVLLNSKKELLGTKINGVVAAELREKGWGRIMSLASRVV